MLNFPIIPLCSRYLQLLGTRSKTDFLRVHFSFVIFFLILNITGHKVYFAQFLQTQDYTHCIKKYLL